MALEEGAFLDHFTYNTLDDENGYIFANYSSRYYLIGCNSLKNLKIGSGLLTIENAAFYSCYNLEEIHFNCTLDKFKVITGSDNIKKFALFVLMIQLYMIHF